VPWHELRYGHTQALRSWLAEHCSPAAANRHLAALRGVLREAWRLGLMNGEDLARAVDLASVPGSSLPAGRYVEDGEIRRLVAACLADGTTVIENAAKEPEIVDLAAFLVKRGARIAGAGTDLITIEGVSELRGADHEVIPDRIEAGTYLAAAAITGGDVCVKDCRPQHLEAVTAKLREAGAEVTESKESVRLKVPKRLKSVDVKTYPYPGFATDMQAQMMALMCVAQGTSVITETVFEGRFIHVPELQRMGANIKVDGSHAVVTGTTQLSGAAVMASDLRASAGLVVAGLAAEGDTEIARVYHLDRGYERIEEKLSGLGAAIRRVPGAGQSGQAGQAAKGRA